MAMIKHTFKTKTTQNAKKKSSISFTTSPLERITIIQE